MPSPDAVWPTGAPCWALCQVWDVEAARRFYQALFSWDVTPAAAERDLRIARRGGRPVCGLVAADAHTLGPCSWSTCFATSDLDVTLGRAVKAGGRFTTAVELGSQARVSLGIDVTGASFGLWQGRELPGAAVFNQPNTMCWNELHTRDYDEARNYYRRVFGWGYTDLSDGPSTDYVLFSLAGRSGGLGGIHRDPVMDDQTPNHWLVWFAVDSVDRTVAVAVGLGAGVLAVPQETGLGRVAVVRGPQGETFGLLQTAEDRHP